MVGGKGVVWVCISGLGEETLDMKEGARWLKSERCEASVRGREEESSEHELILPISQHSP